MTKLSKEEFGILFIEKWGEHVSLEDSVTLVVIDNFQNSWGFVFEHDVKELKEHYDIKYL